MRVLRDTALVLLGVFIGATVFLHVFVNINGKVLLIKELKTVFKDQDVSVESVKTSFPFNLIIHNLAVGDFMKAKLIFAAGGAVDIFRGNFSVSELRFDGLTLNLESAESSPVPAESENIADSAPPGAIPDEAKHSVEIALDAGSLKELPKIGLPPVKDTISPPKQKALVINNILLKHLILQDSTVNFKDRTIDSSGMVITVTDVSLDLQNLIYPLKSSTITSFELEGSIPGEEGDSAGIIQARGWFNLFNKDMQAVVKIDDIDGIMFSPYYARWINLQETRINKAKLAFNGNIHGVNNEITADCHLELKEIGFSPRPPEEEPNKAERICQYVLNCLKSISGGNVGLDFSVKTKMDSPKINLGDLKIAFEDSLQKARRDDGLHPEGVFKIPGKILSGTVQSAAELSRALIDGTFSVGKEFKRAFEQSFRKEPDGE